MLVSHHLSFTTALILLTQENNPHASLSRLCSASRWDSPGQHQQFGPFCGGESVSSSRHQRGSGLQCPAACTGGWSVCQEGLMHHQQTGPGCCQGNCWPLWCEWLSVCNINLHIRPGLVQRGAMAMFCALWNVENQNMWNVYSIVFSFLFFLNRPVLSVQATLTLVCLESTPFHRLQLLLMWVSHVGVCSSTQTVKCLDVVCVLSPSPQVIKAALAQVKAVAEGGVTAADLTQAK